MMKKFKVSVLSGCIALFCAASANSADIFTYTESQTGPSNIALGYTVPLPVDSLTPIDGFRSYQSLHARHQQMTSDSEFISAQIIGQTFNGQDIWMYTVSDLNSQTQSGAEEASVLINGGIHAREWQTPEAVTGFIEELYNKRDENYIAAYLVDNLQMNFIPVLNIDGFKQTQQFANQVTQSPAQPRDGRMRRKNRRDVDTDLNTDVDNLLGIDLNRNSQHFWAASNSSSSNPASLVYHGQTAASEPEIQALVNAALLSPSDRLRLFIDVHSFTQIYFTPMTMNSRRNAITTQVMGAMRSANNFKYAYGPGNSGTGIGTTADYFANEFEIPSTTLETEPTGNGAADYGGNGVSHDGFILPNSQVRRMVKETTHATLTGFYAQAEKPILQKVIIRDSSSGETLVNGGWVRTSGGRELSFEQNQTLAANTDYQISLVFNKPMRWTGDSGQVSHFPSFITQLEPTVQWLGADNENNQIAIDLDPSNGSWQQQKATSIAAGYHKYKTDTYTFTANIANSIDGQNFKRMALSVKVSDMLNQALDTNPATVVDWHDGAWSEYENESGEVGDAGGQDKSFRLIDDGSDLYAIPEQPTTDEPTTPTNPTTGELGGGGGSLSWFSPMLLLLGLRRRRR